jgi:hypothetical protein
MRTNEDPIDWEAFIDLRRSTPLPIGLYAYIEPTGRPNRFRIRVSDKPFRVGKIKHRLRKRLTDDIGAG